MTPSFRVPGLRHFGRWILPVLAGLLSFPVFGAADVPGEPGQERLTWPLWEVGVFVAGARLPQYKGSDEYTDYVLPLPYLIYRGDLLKVNREGVQGILWENTRFETSLSFNGNPPGHEDNRAREGMARLGAIGEGGAMLKYSFSPRRSPDPFFLGAAMRAAVSVDPDDLGMAYQGLCGGMKLVYHNRTLLKKQGMAFGLSANMDFSNRDYNQYLYGVTPTDARPDRPAYTAQGGYGGFSLSANFLKTLHPRLSLGAYYRWDHLSGAAFRDSPLVRTENNHVFGFALIWNIHSSKQVVYFSREL